MSFTATETETSSGTGGLQSVDRALHVLELLADWGSGGVSELAAEVGVHKSTVFRLLGALEARDLVEQTSERGKYRLAFGVVRLARRVNVQLELAEQARDLTDGLARKVGESINVAVLREHFVVNIVQSRGHASVVSQNWTGQLTPLHATSSGKILLAHLDPQERADLIGRGLEAFTPHTHTDPVLLEDELARARERGHAVTLGELEVGLHAVAVPVRGDEGTVVAALSASGPSYRMTPARISDILGEMEAAGEELSRRMGF
ncbi:MAG TPA: IclR family transcriptional regulator [Propionibacteriaceae bacterium]